jgi:AraC-like DNA-binding protein
VPLRETLIHLQGGKQEVQGESYGFDASRRPDRPHVVLQMTLDGVAWHERDGRTTLLPYGWVFLEEIPGPFRYGCQESPYALVFLSMQGELAKAFAEEAQAMYGSCFRLHEPAELAADLLALVTDAEHGRLKDDPYATSGRLYDIMTRTFSLADAAKRAGAEDDPLVARGRQLIEQQAARSDFGIAELASTLRVSREHLTRTFSRLTSTTPTELLAVTRLRLAATLLRSTDRPLEDIARRSGFSGSNYLCRQFRKKVGVTPGEFRRRRWITGP